MAAKKKNDVDQFGLLEAKVSAAPGEYAVVVKVIDILGNDTIKAGMVKVM